MGLFLPVYVSGEARVLKYSTGHTQNPLLLPVGGLRRPWWRRSQVLGIPNKILNGDTQMGFY
jgi:hypothetical protein